MAFWLSVPGRLRLSLRSEPMLRAPTASPTKTTIQTASTIQRWRTHTRPRRYSPPVTANSSRRSGSRPTLQRVYTPDRSCWTTARWRVYGPAPCPHVIAPSPRWSSRRRSLPRSLRWPAPPLPAGPRRTPRRPPPTAATPPSDSQGVQLFGTGGAPTRDRADPRDQAGRDAGNGRRRERRRPRLRPRGRVDQRLRPARRPRGRSTRRASRPTSNIGAALGARTSLPRTATVLPSGALIAEVQTAVDTNGNGVVAWIAVHARRPERAGRDAADGPGADHRAAHRATRARSRS